MTAPRAATTDVEALTANQRFYEAFSSAKFEQMNALWARHVPVTCLHPGAAALVGRTAVMESWRALFLGGPPFELQSHDAVVSVIGEVAVVVCYEAASEESSHLVATNVFVREEGEWRLVHHQAGPLSSRRTPARSVSKLVN